jgi:hypothetical protein
VCALSILMHESHNCNKITGQLSSILISPEVSLGVVIRPQTSRSVF